MRFGTFLVSGQIQWRSRQICAKVSLSNRKSVDSWTDLELQLLPVNAVPLAFGLKFCGHYRCRIARCFALDVARPGLASSGRQPNGRPTTQACVADFTAMSVTGARPRLHDTRRGTTFSCFTDWFENSPRTEYSLSWTLSGRRGKTLIPASTSSCVTVAAYGVSKWEWTVTSATPATCWRSE